MFMVVTPNRPKLKHFGIKTNGFSETPNKIPCVTTSQANSEPSTPEALRPRHIHGGLFFGYPYGYPKLFILTLITSIKITNPPRLFIQKIHVFHLCFPAYQSLGHGYPMRNQVSEVPSKHQGPPLDISGKNCASQFTSATLVKDLSGWWFQPTPLKNDGLRQLGWWHSQYMKKNVPNHQPVVFDGDVSCLLGMLPSGTFT